MTKKRGFWKNRRSESSSSSSSSLAIEKALEAQRLKSARDSNTLDTLDTSDNNNIVSNINGFHYDAVTDRYYKVDNKKSKRSSSLSSHIYQQQQQHHHPPCYNIINTLNLRELYAPVFIATRLEYMTLRNIDLHVNGNDINDTNDTNADHRTVNDTHSHDTHGILIIRDHIDGIQIHLNVHQRVSLLRNNKELPLYTEKYKSIDNVCWKSNNNDDENMTLCFTNDHSHNHCGLIIANLIESANKKKIFIKDIAKISLEHSKPIQQCIWSKYDNNNIYLVEENGVKACSLNSINPCRYIMKMKSPLKYCCCSDTNTLITGFRNGKIINYDIRQNEIAIDIGNMNYAIDYIHCLRNNHSIIVQDILGTIKIFDQRKPNMIKQTIWQARDESHFATQIKRFWLSDNENMLATANNTQLNFFDIRNDETLLFSKTLNGIDLDYYNNITISSQASNNDSINSSYISGLSGCIHSSNYNFQDAVWFAKM